MAQCKAAAERRAIENAHLRHPSDPHWELRRAMSYRPLSPERPLSHLLQFVGETPDNLGALTPAGLHIGSLIEVRLGDRWTSSRHCIPGQYHPCLIVDDPNAYTTRVRFLRPDLDSALCWCRDGQVCQAHPHTYPGHCAAPAALCINPYCRHVLHARGITTTRSARRVQLPDDRGRPIARSVRLKLDAGPGARIRVEVGAQWVGTGHEPVQYVPGEWRTAVIDEVRHGHTLHVHLVV